MKNTPFNEEAMRKFTDVKKAFKEYLPQGISQRKILLLWNQTFAIEIGTTSMNVNYLNSVAGKKFVEAFVGKSTQRELALKKEIDAWKTKFRPTIDEPKESAKLAKAEIEQQLNAEKLAPAGTENVAE